MDLLDRSAGKRPGNAQEEILDIAPPGLKSQASRWYIAPPGLRSQASRW
jgi:hypothetical protein